MKITDLLENRGTLIPIVAVLCFAYTTYRGGAGILEKPLNKETQYILLNKIKL